MVVWQERVVEEKRQLDERRIKLEEFMCGDIYRTLSIEERARMHGQLGIMQQYSQVLAVRIAHFEEFPDPVAIVREAK